LLQSTDGNLSNLADNSDILPEKTPSVEINNPEVELDTRNFNTTTNQPELKAEYAMSTTDNLVNANLSDKNTTLQSPQIETVAVVQTNRHDVNYQAEVQDLNTDNSLKGLAKEAVEQIKVNITKSAVKNVDTIDIELKPEELGKVQVRMYIHKDGKLHADIIASRQTTAEMLQREVENLSKAFQDAGYDTDKQSFNFSSQEENQAGRQSGEQKLQQFIGETLEQEAEETTANDNLIYDPRVGLNIRV
jgi:flagellar hook-length control protein FliK